MVARQELNNEDGNQVICDPTGAGICLCGSLNHHYQMSNEQPLPEPHPCVICNSPIYGSNTTCSMECLKEQQWRELAERAK